MINKHSTIFCYQAQSSHIYFLLFFLILTSLRVIISRALERVYIRGTGAHRHTTLSQSEPISGLEALLRLAHSHAPCACASYVNSLLQNASCKTFRNVPELLFCGRRGARVSEYLILLFRPGPHKRVRLLSTAFDRCQAHALSSLIGWKHDDDQ